MPRLSPLPHSFPVHVLTWLVLAFTLSCSRDKPSPTPVTQRPQETSKSFTFYFAYVARIGLKEAGLPLDTKPGQLSVSEGNAEALTVENGEIRFFTPSDPGEDVSIRLKVALGARDVFIPVIIRSLRQTSIQPYIEKGEDGLSRDPANLPKLRVKGLSEDHTLQEEEWSFSVSGAPPLDATESSGVMSYKVDDSLRHVEIGNLWTLNAPTNSLVLSAANVKALLDQVPAGDVYFTIVPRDAADTLGLAWEYRAYKPGIRMQGQVVDPEGRPVGTLAGRKMALRAVNDENGIRKVVSIDEQGKFEFDNLLVGTYWLDLLDVNNPSFWRESVAIYPGSTTLDVSFRYFPVAQKKNATAPFRITANFIQDGRAPRRDVEGLNNRSAVPSSCESAAPKLADRHT